MSLSSLLEILRSQAKIVSDENAARIHLNINFQAGHRIVYDYIYITSIKNIQQKDVLKCVVCNKICLFPIVISMWSCNLWLLCSSF